MLKSKTITILSGPQGSGNHLFSKIFDLHPDVKGWDGINGDAYMGHSKEPYNEIWGNPDLIDTMEWGYDHHVISISCPYLNKGTVLIPDYKAVVDKFLSKGFNVQIGIISRDKNILELQQTRLRGEPTSEHFHNALEYLTSLPHTFLSFETAMIYQLDYVEAIGKLMGIPINLVSEHYEKIFSINSNKAYISQIDEGDFDKEARGACRE